MSWSYRMRFPSPEELREQQHHGHWRRRQRLRKAARDEARLLIRVAGTPDAPLQRARLSIRCGFPKRGRFWPKYDTLNVIGALKPCVDALVDEGVIADDNHEILDIGSVGGDRDPDEDGFVVLTVEGV